MHWTTQYSPNLSGSQPATMTKAQPSEAAVSAALPPSRRRALSGTAPYRSHLHRSHAAHRHEVGQRRPSRAQRRAVPVQSTKSATTTKSTFVYTSLTNAILAGPGEEFSAAAQAAIRTGVTAQLKQLASEVPSQFRCFVALAKRSPTGRWWSAEAERASPFD